MTCETPETAPALLKIATEAMSVLARPAIRYIGDIHGKRHLYEAALKGCSASVQVGDFGYGFHHTGDPFLLDWPRAPGHRFIRGNHDNPTVCYYQQNHIDSGFERGVFYLGGEWSIDRHYRTPGVSWWPDEEHSEEELETLIDIYTARKPTRVVSHGAPSQIAKRLFGAKFPPGPSRTSQALGVMLTAHRPAEWVFGHWHAARDEIIDGTRFICLPEGGWVDLPDIAY